MNRYFAKGPALTLLLLSVVVLLLSACAQPRQTGLGGGYNPPAVGEDLVFISAVDGYLYALNKDTGDLSWRRRPARDPEMELVSGPALAPHPRDADRQLVVVGAEDGNLYAYDAASGDPAWTPFTTDDKIWSTPVIRDGVIYFGSHDYNVYAVSLADGREVWRFGTGGAVVGRALLFRDMVIMGSFDRKLYALDAASGALRWEFEAENWFAWASPVTNDRTIFAPSMDGNLYALDELGNLLWRHQMGSSIVSTPVLLPEGLLVAGKDGRFVVLNTDPVDVGPARAGPPYRLRDAEVKAPLFTPAGPVFVGGQDSVVRRFEVRAGQVQPIWCFDTRQNREVPCD